MIRSFDLSTDYEELDGYINHPDFQIVTCKISCSESGYTTANLRLHRAKEPFQRKRYREIRRFILFNGFNNGLDELMENPETKVIQKYEFFTEQGVIIVLDYEKERS